MTPSVSPVFRALCYLRKDSPPHQSMIPPSTESMLPHCLMIPPPPSTVSILQPLNQSPPPRIVSTLPPLHMLPQHQRSSPLSITTPPLFSVLHLLPSPPLPPSNVTLARPSYSASLPLPTMLTPSSAPLPSNSLTLPPPLRTCHRMSVSIGLEALPTLLQIIRAQMIRDRWPSGATVTCLPNPDSVPPRHLRDEQLVLEYLHRT